jgi:hypothetical protein
MKVESACFAFILHPSSFSGALRHFFSRRNPAVPSPRL